MIISSNITRCAMTKPTQADAIPVAGGWVQFSPTLGVFRALTNQGRITHHETIDAALEALAPASGQGPADERR